MILQCKNLKKSYKAKGNVVKALDGINLELGAKGFVFILGKSGSGKSTLLNILGGLDRFDSGDLIIKEKSFKNFKASEWDSYRNTYLGFVFQDFNLISNYTIEKNIKLALELQSYPKKKINQRVKEILEQVELSDVGKRKPNQLSGGQKQRIAIARALVKNPEIILADEPTGNLDSETGKAILNTLKKLSKEKLVLMVSHDKENANRYADRIITIKDGKVKSDEFTNKGAKLLTEDIDNYESHAEVESIVRIPKKATDKKELEKYFIKYKGMLYMPVKSIEDINIEDDLYLPVIKDIERLNATTEKLENPAEVSLNEKTKDKFKLIKSKLPYRYSLKMAFKNLFRKKIKLIFTILLFVASLTFFGFSETANRFDLARAQASSYEQANLDMVSFVNKGDKKDGFYSPNVPFEESYFKALDKNYTNIKYAKSYKTLSINRVTYENKEIKNSAYLPVFFTKFVEIENYKDFGIEFETGKRPSNINEIAITDFMARAFKNVVGTKIKIDDIEYTVSGIVKTDYKDFEKLKSLSSEELIKYSGESKELQTKKYTIYSAIFVNKDFFKNHESKIKVFNSNINVTIETAEFNYYSDVYMPASSLPNNLKEGFIGNPNTTLKDGELILTLPGELSEEDANKYIGQKIKVRIYDTESFLDEEKEIEFTIKGFVRNLSSNADDIERIVTITNENTYNKYFAKEKGTYSVFVSLDKSKEENIKFFADPINKNISHNNEIASTLELFDDFRKGTKKIFNIVSLVLGSFAMVLMYTMISSSVLSKKREIGTLRAIGARGIDVGNIFVTEALIIGILNLSLAVFAVFQITNFVNRAIYNQLMMNLSIFNLSPIIILEMFAVSFAICFVSSFLPVKRVTLMKPIDAIRSN